MVDAHYALIPAAGVGARMGGACPKQYLPLASKPLLWHTVQAFLASPGISRVYLVVSAQDGWIDQVFPLCPPRLQVLRCGGATRQESVCNGLLAMPCQPNDWVLVHDAARPGITPQLIAQLQQAVAHHPVGGLLALPVVDTVKQQQGDQVRTLDRSTLWLAQTPQMFRYQMLLQALQQRDIVVTDEASAIESCGYTPLLVPGAARNFKVTVAEDLALMQAWLAMDKK
ncbi:MAG: 2-C-methyl-D-erythritol 4-phosphate cytidylyltransferase [Pseudomonadota bacterium]